MMRAAVYRGPNRIPVERVAVPQISDGELLVKVEVCGVCGTDLKKVELGLVEPPRIFGHEIAGTVEEVGKGVDRFGPGDRVVLYHHIPCLDCFFCAKKLFSQCAHYRRTGTTAGYQPAGGGFAEYVRVMDWIAAEGTFSIPKDVSFEEASFLEPLNTCLKALETAGLRADEVVTVLGQGPIGLMLMQAAALEGARVIGVDPIPERLAISAELGAPYTCRPGDVQSCVEDLTEGRGADLAIVATAAPSAIDSAQSHVRRGGRVLLFAQTAPNDLISIDASRVCVEEKQLIGSYSSSVELHQKAADLIFKRKVNVASLVSHRFPLEDIAEGIRIASNPSPDSLKVLIQP
jgi:L-iditol 2-dehydrogenase